MVKEIGTKLSKITALSVKSKKRAYFEELETMEKSPPFSGKIPSEITIIKDSLLIQKLSSVTSTELKTYEVRSDKRQCEPL